MTITELQFAARVDDTPVQEELSRSMLAYSLSVIGSRAIPDVRDGLKPSQRRLLYAMYADRLYPSHVHVKCAKVVGSAVGNYHPHGPDALYETMVRMGQDFSLNVPFIDPHGNFGTNDDPPAAYRYTECRLTPAALDLVGELDQDGADMMPTFDGTGSEPVYLPGPLPSLLVNGTSGIAVGFTTLIAPHNFLEIITATKSLLINNDDQLPIHQIISGPDFPTGGIARISPETWADLVATGVGNFSVEAAVAPLARPGGRHALIVTQLPYTIGPEKIVSQINDLIKSGMAETVASVADHSDAKGGLQVVIECKPGADPAAVWEKLLGATDLRRTFAAKQVVLNDGVPETMGHEAILRAWTQARLGAIKRYHQFQMDKVSRQLLLAQGILAATNKIGWVIKLLQGVQLIEEAREALMKGLSINREQADYILDMPLRRLVGMERSSIQQQVDDLTKQQKHLKIILASPTRQRVLLIDQLDQMAKKYGRPRRTKVVTGNAPALSPAAVGAPRPAWVQYSAQGLLGRLVRPSRMTLNQADVLMRCWETPQDRNVIGIDPQGRVSVRSILELPEIGRTRGTPADEVFTMNPPPAAVILSPIEPQVVCLISAKGEIKATAAAVWGKVRTGANVIKMNSGDYLVDTFETQGDQMITMISSDGYALRFDLVTVRQVGLPAAGVAGMKTNPGAAVVWAGAVSNTDLLVIQTERGYQVIAAGEVATQNRGTRGKPLLKTRIMAVHAGSAGQLSWLKADEVPTPIRQVGQKIPKDAIVGTMRPTKTPRSDDGEE